jgi:hypothetical protein
MKRDGRYEDRPGNSTTALADLVVVGSGSRGRVWAISSFATTAAATQVTIRSGVSAAGVALWRMDSGATIGDGGSAVFPVGLTYSNGLFIDVVAGAPQVSICYSIDDRADV